MLRRRGGHRTKDQLLLLPALSSGGDTEVIWEGRWTITARYIHMKVGCCGSMPDRIDLTNVTNIKYQPSRISSCWKGSGTIVIQSSHQEMPEIKMRVGAAEEVCQTLREAWQEAMEKQSRALSKHTRQRLQPLSETAVC